MHCSDCGKKLTVHEQYVHNLQLLCMGEPVRFSVCGNYEREGGLHSIFGRGIRMPMYRGIQKMASITPGLEVKNGCVSIVSQSLLCDIVQNYYLSEYFSVDKYLVSLLVGGYWIDYGQMMQDVSSDGMWDHLIPIYDKLYDKTKTYYGDKKMFEKNGFNFKKRGKKTMVQLTDCDIAWELIYRVFVKSRIEEQSSR